MVVIKLEAGKNDGVERDHRRLLCVYDFMIGLAGTKHFRFSIYN